MVGLASFLLIAAQPLAPGVRVVHHEIVYHQAADIVVSGPHTTLRAADDFQGRALIVCEECRNVTFSGFTLVGHRAAPHGLPPSNVSFAEFERHNGLLILGGEGIRVSGVSARHIAGYAILVSHARDVTITAVSVLDSGSRNEKGRNNATGGILLEDGTSDFVVRGCTLERILGNGIWTHSRLERPRNTNGRIENNVLADIGRDAIEVGHASEVDVRRNRGRRIGYPFDAVDAEGGGIPVALDTAGNADRSTYALNVFHEVNGKCIDLDGFHHGSVENNSCVNDGGPDAYPHGHFGIVFNNNNPQMRSENVTVRGNLIEGFKYGGLFLLGSGHHILNNRFIDINRSGCPESHAKYGCMYFPGQPDLLSSGIYLGVSAADWSRKEPAHANVIVDNTITGHGMDKRCIVRAPGVAADANVVARNHCAGR